MNSFPNLVPRVLSYPSLRVEEDLGNEVAHFRCGVLNKAQGNLYLWGGSFKASTTATASSLKKWIRAASNFIALFHLVQFVKHRLISLELNSKGLYQSSGKEKESHCLVFTSPTNVKLGIFTSLSCNDGKEMYKKAWCTCEVVYIVQSCFLPFSMPSSGRCLRLCSHCTR